MSARTSAPGTGTKTRWRVAAALNRLPWTCWADLVTWALGWTRLREIAQTDTCRRDAAESGDDCCYCGKIQDGRPNSLAARIRYAATTDQPQSARTVARARWIGRFCSVVLLALGAWSAATGTLPSTLVALFTIPAGIWCWRYQRRMRGAR